MPMSDEPVTRREVDQILAATVAASVKEDEARKAEAAGEEQIRVERWRAHEREHDLQADALNKALQNEIEQQKEHNLTHAAAHDSHDEKHKAEDASVKTALAAVDRERTIHSDAHGKEHIGHAAVHDKEQLAVHTALAAVDRERSIHAEAHAKEHEGHQREHNLNNLAIDKAEQATDKRFSAVNGTRDTMNDLIRSLASKDTVDGLAADHARRWEELRKELDRRFDEQRVAITNIEKGDVKGEGKEIGRAAMVAIIVTALGIVGTLLSILIVVANVLSAKGL